MDDSDMLERALDAAEAHIQESDTEEAKDATPSDTTEAASVPDEAIESASAASKAEAPKQQKDKAAANRNQKKADRQAPTIEAAQQVSDQSPNADAQESEAVEQSTEPPINPPQFWSAEKKALFAKAPRDLQQAITEHEAQRNEYVNRLANESERARAFEKRAGEIFKPYELKLKAQGVDPLGGIERLLAWNEILESDMRGGIVGLMRRNNLTPQDIAAAFDGYEEPQNQSDPRIEEAIKRAEAAEQKFESWRQEQERAALMSEVEAFKDGKDSTGQVRRAFCEMYAPQISQAADAIARNYPQLPRSQQLHQAYEHVRAEVAKFAGVLNGSQQQPTNGARPQAQQIKKAAAAASSVVGAPSSGTAPKRPAARSIDEALDRAEERMGQRY